MTTENAMKAIGKLIAAETLVVRQYDDGKVSKRAKLSEARAVQTLFKALTGGKATPAQLEELTHWA